MSELDVGRSLRVAKARVNWSTAQVALKLGVSSQRVRDMSKRQHASTATVARLADAFSMAPDEFIRLGLEE